LRRVRSAAQGKQGLCRRVGFYPLFYMSLCGVGLSDGLATDKFPITLQRSP